MPLRHFSSHWYGRCDETSEIFKAVMLCLLASVNRLFDKYLHCHDQAIREYIPSLLDLLMLNLKTMRSPKGTVS